MDFERSSRHSKDIHRQHDDWDNVHQQLLTIQKKSLEVSDPNDANEREADEVARKVVNGQPSEISSAGGTIQRKAGGDYRHAGEQIQRTFDVNTATQRIQGTSTVTKFALRDKDNNHISYDKDDEKKGDIYLPNGVQVSKLDPNPLHPSYIHVIAWYEGKYREGYIHQSAFAGTYSGGTKYDAEIFINDAYHTLYRAEKRFEQDQPNNKKAFPDFQLALDRVKLALADYENGKLQITNEMLTKLNAEQKETLKTDKANKPETLQRLSSAIFTQINPDENGGKFSDHTLYVPITMQWINSNKIMQDLFKSEWVPTGISQYVGLPPQEDPNPSGEGVTRLANLPMFDLLFTAFGHMWEAIKNTSVAQTPEGQWLSKINDQTKKNTERLIFIHSGSWESPADKRFADGVPINYSFGPLQSSGLMALMLHETNVNSAQTQMLPSDTHMTEEGIKKSWDASNEGRFSGEVSNNAIALDNLFEANSYMGIILLGYDFDQLRKMQKKE